MAYVQLLAQRGAVSGGIAKRIGNFEMAQDDFGIDDTRQFDKWRVSLNSNISIISSPPV